MSSNFANLQNQINALKDLYSGDMFSPWYGIPRVKEEFIRRIQELGEVERALVGIED